MSHASIRLLIVDDQAIIRAGLRSMLELEPDIAVVGDCSDGQLAITRSAELRPDVVLMDVQMPNLGGIDATRHILRERTAGAVLIITTFDDEQYLLDSVRAGASGFLLKDAGPDLLAAAIRAANRGDALVDPAMTRSLLEHRLAASSRDESVDQTGNTVFIAPYALSDRELEVLAALARGLSNAEISLELFITEGTVKSHVSSILLKTNTSTRVQAAVLAYEIGFVRPGWLGG